MENKKKDNTEIKRIYRSETDKMIGGVCGGIAQYLNIDSVWIRLITVILIFFDGIGLLLYIIFWIIIPKNPSQINNNTKKTTEETKQTIQHHKKTHKQQTNDNSRFIIGGTLIIIGTIFLLKPYFNWLSFSNLWPLILITVGAILLFRRS